MPPSRARGCRCRPRLAWVAALAAVVVACAFGPLRRRAQAAVDWRFDRPRYDGLRRVHAFVDDVREGTREPEDVGDRCSPRRCGIPSAELLYRLPASGRLGRVAAGTSATLPPTAVRVTTVEHRGQEIGVLLHAPSLLDRPDLLRSVLAAASLAIEIARLRVEVRVQLAEVEESRSRVVQAGYEERRRLERDLHDGAQQRLVTLGIVLRRLQLSLPREARILGPALDSAVDEVGSAIEDLRTIAAGVRPPRLDEGLAAALADLARGAPVPVELEATQERLAPQVEAAAYFVACEAVTNAVKHASASHVRIEATVVEGALRWWSPTTASAARGDRRHRADRPRRPRRGPGRETRDRQPARRRHAARGGDPVRIVIAEDTVLLREGLAGLLEDAGHEVVARVGDADALLVVVAEHEPDLAVIDVRMPPDYDHEGMRAAAEIRRDYPQTAVLVLSQHIETRYALELVATGGGFGYLLKERVLDVDDFLDAARRVCDGGSALDPEVVRAPLAAEPRRPARRADPARARGARADGRGTHERGDREAALADRAHRRDARPLDPRQARPARRRRRPPPRARRADVPARSELAPSPTTLRTGAGPEDRGPREI